MVSNYLPLMLCSWQPAALKIKLPRLIQDSFNIYLPNLIWEIECINGFYNIYRIGYYIVHSRNILLPIIITNIIFFSHCIEMIDGVATTTLYNQIVLFTLVVGIIRMNGFTKYYFVVGLYFTCAAEAVKNFVINHEILRNETGLIFYGMLFFFF